MLAAEKLQCRYIFGGLIGSFVENETPFAFGKVQSIAVNDGGGSDRPCRHHIKTAGKFLFAVEFAGTAADNFHVIQPKFFCRPLHECGFFADRVDGGQLQTRECHGKDQRGETCSATDVRDTLMAVDKFRKIFENRK